MFDPKMELDMPISTNIKYIREETRHKEQIIPEV